MCASHLQHSFYAHLSIALHTVLPYRGRETETLWESILCWSFGWSLMYLLSSEAREVMRISHCCWTVCSVVQTWNSGQGKRCLLKRAGPDQIINMLQCFPTYRVFSFQAHCLGNANVNEFKNHQSSVEESPETSSLDAFVWKANAGYLKQIMNSVQHRETAHHIPYVHMNCFQRD